jgi:hypothetical protein
VERDVENRQARVRSGEIVVQRLFDVAYAIDLARAEASWSNRTGTASARRRLTTTPAKAMAFDVPPVALVLESADVEIAGRSTPARVSARLYDFGVATLSVTFPVTDMAWPDYVRFADAADRAIGPGSATTLWATLIASLRARIGQAFVRPSATMLEEDYLLAIVREFDEPMTAAALQARVDIAPLLAGDQRPLAESARSDLLRRQFSYYTDDLVALTWDRAFIVEPRDDSDVADVLEVANAQLLELRWYDELLDAELPRMREHVAETHRAFNLFAPRRLARLARKLYSLVAEVTELREKVDNALQVTEDVYLARVYSAALDLMRVPEVGAAVDRKLAIVRDTYAALYAEASATRAGLLETTIILLIAFEIVLSLVRA